MIDNELANNEQSPIQGPMGFSFLGLSPNLWRLALVLAITQFSIGLWKWEYGVFLETIFEPWQIGITFSIIPLSHLLGSILAGKSLIS